MVKKGILLEKSVERLFKYLGFSVQRNVKIKGHEIDIFATLNDKKFVIECKQRDISETINIKNLIHEWNSKNSMIKADSVILIIYGLNISSYHKNLANKFSIIIWDTRDFEKFYDLAMENKEKAKSLINQTLGIRIGRPKKEVIVDFEKEKYEKLKNILQVLFNNFKFELLHVGLEFIDKESKTVSGRYLCVINAIDIFDINGDVRVLEEDKFKELAISENWKYKLRKNTLDNHSKNFNIYIKKDIANLTEVIDKIFHEVYNSQEDIVSVEWLSDDQSKIHISIWTVKEEDMKVSKPSEFFKRMFSNKDKIITLIIMKKTLDEHDLEIIEKLEIKNIVCKAIKTIGLISRKPITYGKKDLNITTFNEIKKNR